MSLVIFEPKMKCVRSGLRSGQHRRPHLSSAIHAIILSAFAQMVVFGSVAFGQPRNPVVNRMMMREYMSQYNKMNEQQRKASADDARTMIKKSDAEIKKLDGRLSNLKGELDDANGQVERYSGSLSKCESELRESRKQRADREEKILSSQTSDSRYQSIVQRMKGAGEEAKRQVERVLGRAVKDAEPEKLRLALKKNEFKLLEDDPECSAAFKQFRKVREEKGEEVKRLMALDGTIDKLDDAISVDNENRKILKSQLAAARAKKKKLSIEKDAITTGLESARHDREAAELYLARVLGKT